jgi:coproporphyrinogen III oxidase
MVEKEKIVHFLKHLREEIISAFEALEPYSRFERKTWSHPTGGGGEMAVLRGSIFEKAAVNWSGVQGETFPLQEASGPYFATGISLITHMYNPHAPTVHMNLRFIQTVDKEWLGGGYDLTPMGFPYEEDTAHFHLTSQAALDPFGNHFYPEFSKNAREYFFIPHWNKERGIGGIFFDHIDTCHLELWKAVGLSFLKTILPIYERRIMQPYTRHDKETQLKLRAHYVEFNLLYDRGTQFGFRSGGNPEAILCSMPPLVKW